MTGQRAYNAIDWTHEEIKFLRDNFNKYTNPQLATMLNKKLTTLRSKLHSLGLKRMEMEYFTDEMVDYLKQHYTTIGDTELAEIFQQKFPKNKKWTKKHIIKKRRYLKLKHTPEHIKAIHKHNVLTGRFKCCPVKAWITRGVSPVGSIREWKTESGRSVLVIKTENGYMHYNRYVWQTCVGPIPKGYVVRTKDNNHLNITLDNLECISREEHAKRNAIWNMPDEWIEVHLLIRKINQKLKKHNYAS